MTTYLVDFENVQHQGLIGYKKLKHTDLVVIFYTDNDKIPITLALEFGTPIPNVGTFRTLWYKIESPPGKVESKRGKNYLDFQLTSYIAAQITRLELNKDSGPADFVIVSKDQGYQAVVDFWLRHNKLNIKLQPNIQGAPANSTTQKKSSENKVKAASIPIKTVENKSIKPSLRKMVGVVLKKRNIASPTIYTTIYNLLRSYSNEPEFLSAVDKKFPKQNQNGLGKDLIPVFHEFQK